MAAKLDVSKSLLGPETKVAVEEVGGSGGDVDDVLLGLEMKVAVVEVGVADVNIGEVLLGLETKVAVVEVEVLLELEVEVILEQACDRELTFGMMIDSEQEFRMHASAFGW